MTWLERVYEVLEVGVAKSASVIASDLGLHPSTGPTIVRNYLKALYDAGRVDRIESFGVFVYKRRPLL